MDDNYNQSPRCMGTMASTTMSTLPPPPTDHNMLLKLDDYQEPYQALKYAPYYSYSTVVMEMRDMLNKGSVSHSGKFV